MNWKAKIFKPQWESRQADKRLQSVRSEQQSDFWQALPGIIQNDLDYRVRLAALERLLSIKAKDPMLRFEFVYALLEANNSKSITDKEQADAAEAFLSKIRQYLQQAFANLSIDSNTTTTYLRQYGDPQLRDKLAAKAKAPSVRRAAIELISANGKLGDLALTETDAKLRQLAVSKIDKKSTLERVAKALRTTDKKLYHAITERLLDFQNPLTDGLTDADQHHAQAICRQLEEQIKNPGLKSRAELKAIENAWQQTSEPGVELKQRYQTLLATLKTAIDGSAVRVEVKPPPVEPAPEAVVPPPQVVKSTPQQQGKTRAVLDQERFVAAEQLATSITEQQDLLAAKIEAVELTAAVELLHSIRKGIAKLGNNPQGRKLVSTLDGRQSRLYGRVRELRDWQHWSNNKIRTELIANMRNLESSLHPDAVMTALRDARASWKKLEAGEQLPGDKHFHTPGKLWREFNQACEQAFNHIKPFLDKRHEIQDDHLKQDQQLLRKGKELLESEKPDLKQLIAQQRELRAAMRSLEKIPANKRGKLANQIRRQLDALQKLIGVAFEAIELEKARLIRKAEQLKHIEDPQAAIEQAKQLQRQWQATGSGRRKYEQELWDKFRTHLDPLFAQQAEEKSVQDELASQQLTQLQEVYEQLNKISAGSAEELAKQSGIVQSLQNKWLELAGDKLRGQKKLQQNFQAALDKFKSKLARYQQQQLQLQAKARQSSNKLLLRLLKLLQDKPDNLAAKAEEIISQWPRNSASSAIDKLLNDRFQYLQEALQTGTLELDESAENLGKYRDLCLNLEYLAGLESPKAEKEQRMQLQIKRLSASMSGEESRLPLQQEVAELELNWYQLPLISQTLLKTYHKRFNRAMNELQLQLGKSS